MAPRAKQSSLQKGKAARDSKAVLAERSKDSKSALEKDDLDDMAKRKEKASARKSNSISSGVLAKRAEILRVHFRVGRQTARTTGEWKEFGGSN